MLNMDKEEINCLINDIVTKTTEEPSENHTLTEEQIKDRIFWDNLKGELEKAKQDPDIVKLVNFGIFKNITENKDNKDEISVILNRLLPGRVVDIVGTNLINNDPEIHKYISQSEMLLLIEVTIKICLVCFEMEKDDSEREKIKNLLKQVVSIRSLYKNSPKECNIL